jgi:hypothetical protein
MSIAVRIDSLYQFADPIYDERQEEYVWGISDPPEPVVRDDDQFYEIRDGDRLDLIADQYLGSSRYFWVILHYNGIANALDLDNWVGKQVRLPSLVTLQKVYTNAVE